MHSERGLIRLLLLILVVVGAGLFATQQPAVKSWLASLTQGNTSLPELLTPETEISTPGPLRGIFDRPAQALTRAGIFAETNRHRVENKQKVLKENTLLNTAAELKLQDMLARQYFEHVGPDGKGPADWVEAAHYNYIRVGENLALGNFDGDVDVSQAWMDSPGHRENMLSPKFTEIGIAAAQGTFEGKRVWLAVQTFGYPLTACATPTAGLQQQAEQGQHNDEARVNILQEQEKALNAETDALKASAAEIAALITQGNHKIEEGNAEIQRGNNERGQQLQQEGQALHTQADQKQITFEQRQSAFATAQKDYNSLVAKHTNQQKELRKLLDRYNLEVRTFNACVEA